jgi:hypothetical protein
VQITIKVVSIGPTEIKKGPKNSYSVFELTYKDQDKTKNKKLFSFNREVFGVLSNAQPNQFYRVEMEKKGEYWEWISVASMDAPEEGAAQAATATAKPSYSGGGKGGWQPQSNPEREASIARAVALKAAVDYLAGVAGSKADKTPEGVLAVSNQFEGYLLNGLSIPASITGADKIATPKSDDFDDDFPQ